MVDNIGESIRTYLEREAQLLVLSGKGRARRHLHLGLPVEHRPPVEGYGAGHANTHPPAGPQTDTPKAILGTPPRKPSPNTVTPQEKEQSL